MHFSQFSALPRLDLATVDQIRQLESVRPGLLKKLVEVFDGNAGRFLSSVSEKLQAGDLNALRVGFHSLKGTSGALGAQRMARIASEAELATADAVSSARLPELAKQLQVEYEAVSRELMQIAR